MQDSFARAVLSVVADIPPGCVASYGQIAVLAGYPRNARRVGQVLSHADCYGVFPCHRVVHNNGTLVAGWEQQRILLRNEGVVFTKAGHVDMRVCRW